MSQACTGVGGGEWGEQNLFNHKNAATSTNGCQGLCFFLPLLPLSISHCLHLLFYHSLSSSPSTFSSWLDATQQVNSALRLMAKLNQEYLCSLGFLLQKVH